MDGTICEIRPHDEAVETMARHFVVFSHKEKRFLLWRGADAHSEVKVTILRFAQPPHYRLAAAGLKSESCRTRRTCSLTGSLNQFDMNRIPDQRCSRLNAEQAHDFVLMRFCSPRRDSHELRRLFHCLSFGEQLKDFALPQGKWHFARCRSRRTDGQE
jgi:hypothetical protein